MRGSKKDRKALLIFALVGILAFVIWVISQWPWTAIPVAVVVLFCAFLYWFGGRLDEI